MKNSVYRALDNLHLSDTMSLMLFLLYKVQDIAEYATLSELCNLLDGANLIRLLTYYAGRTITIPSAEDFVILANALLLYQYVTIENLTLVDAKAKLEGITAKQWEEAVNLYVKIIPIMQQYNIDKTQVQSHV